MLLRGPAPTASTSGTPVSNFSSVNSQILLEAGTNEVEVLVFSVAGLRCGVNVAKIREVLDVPQVRRTVGAASPALEGVARVRDMVVPIASLAKCLFPNDLMEPLPSDQLLLLEFNDDLIGFRVNDVENILRISWKCIQPPPCMVGDQALVTGVAVLGDVLIPMLDFESIGVGLGMFSVGETPVETVHNDFPRADHLIAYADDSPLIRELIRERLIRSGFTNLREFRDGQEAWEFLASASQGSTEEQLFDQVAALITDIEMPRMDGLTLTRRVRENTAMRRLPIILFSSIASDANENKAMQVGADVQVSKANATELTPHLARLIAERVRTN